MKRFLIIISLLIAPSMYGQYYEHYSYYMPIIDESIQYLKDNISEDTYNKVSDYLIITESGQIYENPYFGKNNCDKLFDLLPFKDEKGIFEKRFNEKVFKRLKIEKGNSLDHWKVYVLNIHSNQCIVFKKGITYEDDLGIHFFDSDTVALFIYKVDFEQKKKILNKVILGTNLKK